MKECFEFAGKTPVLSATLVTVLVLLLAVFPILPIGGQMLDVMAGYTCPDVVAAMESYGEQGRRVYAWSSGTLDMLFPVVYPCKRDRFRMSGRTRLAAQPTVKETRLARKRVSQGWKG